MPVSWSALTTPFDNWAPITAVIQVGSRIIIGPNSSLDCNPGGGNIYTSDNGGLTWTMRPSPFDIDGSCNGSVNGFAYSIALDRIVAVGNDYTGITNLAYSDDHGDTWTSCNYFPYLNALVCVARDDVSGFFVAGGISGANNIHTSPDGITWTPRSTPWNGSSKWVYGICYAGGTVNLWVAVGKGPTTKSAMMASDPTSTWTSVTSGPFDSAGVGVGGQSVAFDGTVLVALGNHSSLPHAVSLSTDAATWVGQTTDLDGSSAQGLAASSTLILAGGPGGIVESDDHGATWSSATGPLLGPGPGCLAIALGATYSVAGGQNNAGTIMAATTAVATPPVSVRTFEGRAWKWIVRDLKTSVVLSSLTTFATDITTARLLAAAWPASCTVPADDPRVNTTYEQFDDPTWDEPFVAEGIRVLTGFRDTGVDPLWECAYTGIIDQVYDFVEDGVPYTKINASDARKYLDYIPLVDEAGELPGPNGIAYSVVKANVIARAAVENWITNNPGCLAETILDLTSGVDDDCVEVTITFGRGTMVGEVWSQLEQMGVIDIVLDPVHDPADRPGVMSVVNFEPEHGAVRPAAIFAWDLSPRSLPEIGRLEDGTKRANTIQGFTDDIEPVTAQIDPDSITKYGEYWDQRAWPNVAEAEAVEAFGLEDLVFRKNRQTTLSATPAAARAAQPVQDYDIGDRAPFYASKALRKPIAGQARIYGIPFVIGDDARESVQELIVSADAVA